MRLADRRTTGPRRQGRVAGTDATESRRPEIALPPAELAAHPASSGGGDAELYLMCEDIETTMQELRDKGVAFDGPVTEQRWGRVTTVVLPSGARLGLYEPRHASPLF